MPAFIFPRLLSRLFSFVWAVIGFILIWQNYALDAKVADDGRTRTNNFTCSKKHFNIPIIRYTRSQWNLLLFMCDVNLLYLFEINYIRFYLDTTDRQRTTKRYTSIILFFPYKSTRHNTIWLAWYCCSINSREFILLQ